MTLHYSVQSAMSDLRAAFKGIELRSVVKTGLSYSHPLRYKSSVISMVGGIKAIILAIKELTLSLKSCSVTREPILFFSTVPKVLIVF